MVWNHPTPTSQVSSLTSTSKPKVLIGVPYRDEKLYLWWTKDMLDPLHMRVDWCEKAFSMVRGIPVSVARDMIVEAALSDPAVTHILWVDTDNICTNKGNPKSPTNPNDALQMLLACDQPIVSGLYRAKQVVGFNYAMWMDVGKGGTPAMTPVLKDNDGNWLMVDQAGKIIRAITKDANWLQVDAIGHGFCLVRREVYLKLKKPWYPWTEKTPSEDFNFCFAARKAGYLISVFTDVQLRHLGELSVNPDGSVQVLEA